MSAAGEARRVSGGRSAGLRLVLATANADKAREIASLLGNRFDLVPRPAGVPEVVEDADTIEGNARLKAVALCQATGQPAVADDTGLEVDAMGGAPGVHSARFAGPRATYADNVRRLLEELDDVAEGDRTARFRTVALVRWPEGREVVAEGVVEGWITEVPVGARGFGYDPVFVADDPAAGGRTFAQLTPAEKNTISHRGRAFRALAAALANDTA